ncbi:VOC family protein [Dactylosporangium roseum]|uniref:VOC family protein n=1 Tax=Dactylosporangium roseum TaxID=47989 RepID=A0ABY5ZB51_9ACTN|nr:VOC family protein [Dactylosporangium roseum]UWZ39320.1 VOC family protein [Dactylosporangium roseum]
MTAIRTGSAGLNVTDLERSVEFYRRALGFEVIRQSDGASRRYALLGIDDAVLLTLWEQSAARFAADRAGLHHLSFEASTLDDLRAAEARLRAADVAIRDDPEGGDAASAGQLFFTDPDGIRLEIYTDDPQVPPVSEPGPPRCGFFGV